MAMETSPASSRDRTDKALVAARAALARWRNDPVLFAREVLGIRLWSRQAEILSLAATHARLSVRSGHKCGKALSLDTMIPTPEGWRRFGDLRVGDRVFGDDGMPCRIVADSTWPDRPLMRVHFEDGSTVDVDERHEWTVHTRASRKRGGNAQTLETRELAERLTVPNGGGRRISNFTIDTTAPLQLPERDLPLDPYLLGLWLGDGNAADCGFTGIDGLESAFSRAGFDVRRRSGPASFGVRGLGPILRNLGVLGNKHVPDRYLWASSAQRLALLQGLMDTDGSCDRKGRSQFCNTNKPLAQNVAFLARSLGAKVRVHEKRATLHGRDCGPKWHVEWTGPVQSFRLERKAARVRIHWRQKANAHRRIAITNFEHLPNRQTVRCIEVDSATSLYLCSESLIPTHNSKAVAILALWWVATRPNARVILLAPSYRQIDEIVWREIKTTHAAARIGLGGNLHVKPEGGATWRDGRQIFGFSTDFKERVAGFSGNILYILDEASGIQDEVHEVVSTNPGGTVVMISNPTRSSGAFFDSHHRGALENGGIWKTLHISSEEAAAENTEIPGFPGRYRYKYLANQSWIEARKKEFGADSPYYDIRVRGRFARQSDNAVIPVEIVDAARERWAETAADGDLEIGVDVARFGSDSTCIVARRGLRAFEPIVLQGSDNVAVANRVRQLCATLKRPDERPVVRVDTSNGGGVADILRMDDDKDVVDVMAQESASDRQYQRLRDEVWFSLRAWLRNGGAIPDDTTLVGDLKAPTYKYDEKAQIKVESKNDLRKRLKRSTDRADALALAVFDGGNDSAWDSSMIGARGRR